MPRVKLQNLSKHFERLKLIMDIENNVNQKTVIGIAILKAIKANKCSHDEILTFIKEQAADSRKTMEECIPVELIDRILNYQPKK